MFKPSPPSSVVWCYGKHHQDLPTDVTLIEGLPTEQDLVLDSLVVIDDLMHEVGRFVETLFTKGSHHDSISVVLLTQNVFDKSLRTISLNAHQLVLFKNPRDALQASYIGKQMYPGNPKYFREAFKDATDPPHGYLLCDLRQDTPDSLRLRTGIFPDDRRHVVYVRV